MKVLVIRFSSIGDIILTSPVLRCLKTQRPGVEVHAVTREPYRSLYELNPHIDKVFTIRKSIDEVIPALRRERYDHLIDLHKNFRSLGLRMKLRRPSSSFPKQNLAKWLRVNLKLDILPRMHIVDRYFRAVRGLGVVNDGQGLDFFLTREDEEAPRLLPEAFRRNYIALVTGGRHATKILPEEKLVELIHGLERPVVLLGGPEDRERGEGVARLTGGKVYNASGLFSLGQSAALVKHALVVITNDTGLMHVAAAFRKPIVSIWGNTIPEFGMYPYMPKEGPPAYLAEVAGLRCRPCSKIGHERCPKGHFRCMMDQDTAKICDAVKRMAESATGSVGL